MRFNVHMHAALANRACKALPLLAWPASRHPVATRVLCSSSKATANEISSDGVRRAREKQDAGLRRFYTDGRELLEGMTFGLDGPEGKHAVRVLRCQVDDVVELADGLGNIMAAQVTAVDRNRASLTSIGPIQRVPWTGPSVTLAVACGSLKGGRSDWLVEKATEVGGFSLLPVLTERSPTMGSDRTDSSNPSGQVSRWGRVATAAMKQSRRSHSLRLEPSVSVLGLVERIKRSSTSSFVAAAGGEPLLRVLSSSEDPITHDTSVLLIIGPEGDFTESELASLEQAGAVLVGLGPTRLRVETAAIAALTATCLHWDSHHSG